MISRRRIARLLSVQILYLRNFCDDVSDNVVEDVLSLQDLTYLNRYDEDLFTTLKTKSVKDDNEFTEIIKKFIGNDWQIERIDKLNLAIIISALCEFKYFQDTPIKVIIHEYVTLSTFFVDRKNVNFINGILEKISHSRDELYASQN